MNSIIFREAILPTNAQVEEAKKNLSSSSSPLAVAKQVAKNNLIEWMAKIASQTVVKDNVPFIGLQSTECTKTLAALSIIFSGEKRGEKMMKCFTSAFPMIPKFKEVHGYYAYLLFDGLLLRALNRHPDFDALSPADKLEKLNESVTPQFNSYTSHVQKSLLQLALRDQRVKSEHMSEVLSQLDFSFNKLLMEDLRDTLISNSKKLSPDTSFIYYIGIAAPNQSNRFAWVHVFALEQFQKGGAPAYRLYQSWVNQATLFQDLERWKYLEDGGEAWNEQEMRKFITQLYIFSCAKDRSKIDTKLVFGYSGANFPLFKMFGETLSGISLRWWVDAFHPQECQQNFSQFCSRHASQLF